MFSFELARINSLDIALGALMTVNAKGTFKVKAQLKMNGISFDLKMANEAANILRPKFKKLRIPRGKNHKILELKFYYFFFQIFSLEKTTKKSFQRFQNFSPTDVLNQHHLAVIHLPTLPLLPSSGHMFHTIYMTSSIPMTSLFFIS